MTTATRRAAALARSNRWLLAALAVMLVATTTMDPSTGSAGSGRQLLGGSGSPTVASPTQQPVTPTSPDLAVATRPGSAPRQSAPLAPVGVADGGGVAPPGPATRPLPPERPVGGEPPACPSASVLEAIEEAQAAVESAGGALPIDVRGLVATALGCGQGGAPSNPIDALGVIGELLDSLGIPVVPLPPPPVLPLPPQPPGFDALGPVVLPVCAEVIQQLVTVAAVAPLARLDSRQVVALFDPLIEVCSLFAPQV